MACYFWVTRSRQALLDYFVECLHDKDWLTYDLRWRTLRDAKDLSEWRKITRAEVEMIPYSDDVAHGLRWINQTFAHSVEAISHIRVYHSLAELDIPAAAAMISKLYLQEGPWGYGWMRRLEHTAFKAMMDDQSSPNEMQKRDMITAYYLHLHQDRHPALKMGYVETVIRILNTQDVYESFYGWFSEILQDLASKPLLAPSVTTKAASQLNTNEITIQTLLCVKFLITQDKLTIANVANACTVLRQLLTLPPPPLPNLRHSTHPSDSEPPNLRYIKLAGGLFEALEGWLSQGEETARWKRVKVCAGGMIRLFPSSIDIAALHVECPVQMAKAAGLMRALDVHLSRLGGAAAVLERKTWTGEETYKVGEWDLLVSGFKGIEGGGGHSVEITTP